MDFAKRVGIVCRRIPSGKVATYGQIALLCGKPQCPRQVGGVLSRGTGGPVPAHRVLDRRGFLSGAKAFLGPDIQRLSLEAEGVAVSREQTVDLARYGWRPTPREVQELERLFAQAEGACAGADGERGTMEYLDTVWPEERAALYPLLAERMAALLEGEADQTANLANAAALLWQALPRLNWAGFYRRVGDELVLGPFQGKPACVRIPWGRGVCGTAAAQGTPQLVVDVRAFPGHIACDSASRSELVIPLAYPDGQTAGVMDLDSPFPGRFTREDLEGLLPVAQVVRERALPGPGPFPAGGPHGEGGSL